MQLTLPCLHAQGHSDAEPGGDAEAARLAVQDSDEYAWQLFLFINRQALPGKAGVADPAKKTVKEYDPDKDVVWETWALASADGTPEAEVFLAQGQKPPAWKDLKRGGAAPKHLDRTFTAAAGALTTIHPDRARPNLAPNFVTTDPASDEVRMNESTFSTVRDNDFFSREGLAAAFAAATSAGNREFIQFNPPAKEVKARWTPITEADKPNWHWKVIDGQIYGLAAFHIITKDLPMWYWTDFIHKSLEPGEPAGSTHDSTTRGPKAQHGKDGIRTETVGSKWENYRLKGSQIAFTDSRGNATILGNELIESGNAAISSCITCHANAGVGPGGSFRGSGFIVGTPPSGVFGAGNSMAVLQTDFLYSIPVRAHSHSEPAPAAPVAALTKAAPEITHRFLEDLPPAVAKKAKEADAATLDALRQGGVKAPELVLTLRKLWHPGQVVKVAFKGGSKELHKRIAEATAPWTTIANIRLDFGLDASTGEYRTWSTGDFEYTADIRISFDQPGYYSNVGTDSIDPTIAPAGTESMNFGKFDLGLPPDWRGTVLHEFGHALGAEHEHQHPETGCDFRFNDDPGYVKTTDSFGQFIKDAQGRRPGLYTVLGGPPNKWAPDKVDFNLKRLTEDSHAFSMTGGVDKASIMKYYFEAWMFVGGTQSPCFSTSENLVLSLQDIEGMKANYPFTLNEMQGIVQQRQGALNAIKEAKTLGAKFLKRIDSLRAQSAR